MAFSRETKEPIFDVGLHAIEDVLDNNPSLDRHVTEPFHPPVSSFVLEALRESANSPIPMCVVIGFDPGSVSFFISDPLLSKKRISWLVQKKDWVYACSVWAMHPALRGRLLVGQADTSAEALNCLQPGIVCVVILPGACIEQSDLLRSFAMSLRQRCFSSWQYLQTCELALSRASHLSQTVPFQNICNFCRGMPAICVSAGPSLDRRIDMLRGLQDRALIIAVDLVATRLQQAGINPDIIFSLDVSSVIAQRLRDFDSSRSLLVQGLFSSPHLDQLFPRRVFVDSAPLGERILGSEGKVRLTANVGVSSVMLAESLGCSSILLVGLDLAMEGENLYAQVVADRDEHTAQQLGIFSSQNLYCHVIGNNGSLLKSNALFEFGLKSLEVYLVHQKAIKVYNANLLDNAGALINGAFAPSVAWSEVITLRAPTKSDICAMWDSSPRLASHEGHAIRNDISDEIQKISQDMLSDLRTPYDISCHARTRSLVGQSAIASMALENFWMSTVMLVTLRLLQPGIDPNGYEMRRLRNMGENIISQGASFMCTSLRESSPLVSRAHKISAASSVFLEGLNLSIDLPQITKPQHLVIHLLCYHFYNIHIHLPDLPFPDPPDSLTGLRMACSWKAIIPDEYIVRCVLLAWAEGSPALQELSHRAIASGLMPAEIFDLSVTDDTAWSPTIIAVRSMHRLLEAKPEKVNELIVQAWSWAPLREAAIRILAQRHDHGAALNQLVSAPPCPLEPRQEAIVIQHHPHLERLGSIINRAHGLEEISSMSVAQRYIEVGKAHEALHFINWIRPLSAYYDHAQVLSCKAWAALKSYEQAHAAHLRISDSVLRLYCNVFLLMQFQGPLMASRAVVQQTLLPALDQLAHIAVGIIQQRAQVEARALIAWLEAGQSQWEQLSNAKEIKTIMQGLRALG